ncbi:hypothetical protein ACHAXR_007217 [Thalassiosira sp. AJA248-18]
MILHSRYIYSSSGCLPSLMGIIIFIKSFIYHGFAPGDTSPVIARRRAKTRNKPTANRTLHTPHSILRSKANRHDPTTKQTSLPEDLFHSYMENEDLLPPLVGKTVAITGTTTGLGFALARCAIVKNAAVVLLLNRKSERSERSEKDLHKYAGNGDDDNPPDPTAASKTVIKSIDCDLMSLDSVKKAGRGDQPGTDGFDVQMQTNMLSHFLLTSLVYPSMEDAAEKRGEARIVSQSSSAREFPKVLETKYFEKCDEGTLGGNDAWLISQLALGKDGPWARYGQTKLANSAFAMALHHKLAESKSKIKSVACEPGYSVTPLQSTKHFAGSWLSMLDFMVPKQSASDGSLNAAMACFSPEAKSGDLYAPEKGMIGKPMKVVAGGERQKTGRFGSDKNTCDHEQQKLVWEACEKAFGIEFVV